MASHDRKTGPLLEIACFNAVSGVNAAKGGANRIELCVDYSSGGLTPDPTVLMELKNQVPIPVYTMLRPHSNNFIYDEPDFNTMKSDLLALNNCGADGFVFGILKKTDPGDISKPWIDIEKNTELIRLAGEKPCTFHRAFDCIPEEDWGKALIDIAKCGFASILTSGGPSGDTAIQCIEKLALLFETLDSVRSRLPEGIKAPEIIIGGGVRASNIQRLTEKAQHAAVYHSSALTTGTETVDVDEVKRLKNHLAGLV
ncbi:copper homeostasis protein [Penicillium malachiteum]|uniref:Copper homeostasis protein cutC homolog n=1 Tax=Penicillium malachiteum TaxID=1324776 RepID=A0AAD6HFE8_9EURO|nr:copper homeostasis protein [Penicillium malachiteum]